MEITFSASFPDPKDIRRRLRKAQEDQMREVIRKKLTFPGSEKLSVKVTFGSNGKGVVTFVGDADVTKEAIKRWGSNLES